MPGPLDVTDLDTGRLQRWLADAVDPSVTDLTVARMAGGHSSGAWRVDATVAGARRSMVLKAPELPSVVHERDACREARLLDAAHAMGAPVPAIIAVDHGTTAVGRPCFLMDHVAGRGIPEASSHGIPPTDWFWRGDPPTQRAAYEAFYDALAALHGTDGSKSADGPAGSSEFLAYWRASLLDAVPAPDAAPRQHAGLDWLAANLPPDADDEPSVCMGDARLVNGLFDGAGRCTLVDFEVAHVGHPAADVGYSICVDEVQAATSGQLPPGRPSVDEIWARWGDATGRTARDRDYWIAYGAAILCITTTRWLLLWGFATPDAAEALNPLVSVWENALRRAT